jgi:hypothetical protein
MKNRILYLVLFVVLGFQPIVMAFIPLPTHYANYVDTNLKFALQYAKAKKIPVSICLAQALHESAAGQSTLAVKANNHFGIKAADTTKWTGERFFIEDDDYDKNGKLRKSAFRKYTSAESSYKDYADFLSKSKRYQHLFAIPVEDYRAWANGLVAAGYATDPEYATYLIEKIEKYELYKYDLPNEKIKQNDKITVQEKPKPTPQKTDSNKTNIVAASTPEKPILNKPTYDLTTKPSSFSRKKQLKKEENAKVSISNTKVNPSKTLQITKQTIGIAVAQPACPDPTLKLEPMDAKPVFLPINLRDNTNSN